MRRSTAATLWLATAVLAHFAVTVVHGSSHRGAQVGLGPASMLFVIVVIELAPLAGLLLALGSPRAGGIVVATSMAAALVFGVVNHFVVISPDHVSQVAAEWRPLFSSSAVLLVVTEAVGV